MLIAPKRVIMAPGVVLGRPGWASCGVLWISIKDIFDELFSLVLVNVIWVLISAPLVLIAVLLLGTGATVLGSIVALLAVLPMAPANAGLYTVAQRVTEGRVFSGGCSSRASARTCC